MLWACDPLAIVLLGQTIVSNRSSFTWQGVVPFDSSPRPVTSSFTHAELQYCGANISGCVNVGPISQQDKIYLVMWGAFEVKWQERKGWHIRCGRVFCDKIIKYIYIEQKLGNKILSIKSLSLEWIQKPLCCDMVYLPAPATSNLYTYLAKIQSFASHSPIYPFRIVQPNVVNTESDSRATNIYLPTPGEDRSFMVPTCEE